MHTFPKIRELLFRLRYGFRGVPMKFGDQVIRLDESLRRWDCGSESKINVIMENLLRPGDCVFDIGANFGLHSLLAGNLVGPTGKVYAFEPLPGNLAKLRHHLSLNHLEKIVQIVPSAVSNSPEPHLSFFSGADSSEVTASLVGTFGNSKELIVANTRLDDFAMRIESPVHLIKIDVEGAEVEVLRGAERLLRKDRPVLVLEIHAYAFEDFNTSIDEYEALLEAAGYDSEIISGTTLVENVHYQILCRPLESTN